MIKLRDWVLALALAGSWLIFHGQTATPTPELSSSPTPSSSSSILDSTQLEVTKFVQADYPLEAAAKKLQGKVLIKVHILETGDVDKTEIVSGDPLLAEAAAEAMLSWKFKPFIKDGKPARVTTNLPYTFTLKGYFPEGCVAVASAQVFNAAHHPHVNVPRDVMEGAVIHRVEPDYPLWARQMHIQGDVLLHAVIGEDGKIHELKALCGAPQLVAPSLDAVRRWRYRPYMKDGVPVAVETTVKVQFHM